MPINKNFNSNLENKTNQNSQNSQVLITNHAQNRRLEENNSRISQNHNYSQTLQTNSEVVSQNWFSKWISRPDLTVPIITCIVFAIFFFYNFSFRTGGRNSEIGINSFSLSSARSLTTKKNFIEPKSTNLEFEENTINHILITGQSLSVGETGFPSLSLSQNYQNLRFLDGKFVPLIENTTKTKGDNVETIASGFANNVTFSTKDQKYQILISNNGFGGTQYEKLKKGTELYQKNINEVISAKKIAGQLGKKYRVPAVFVIHGETDNFLGNGSKYSSFLQEWYKDYNTDIKAITGQTNDIYLFTDQMSSFGQDLATPQGIASPSTALGQLEASVTNSRIILVGPKYFLNYTDNLHLNNVGYRKLGEYYAKAYKQTILNQNSENYQTWKPLSPIKSFINGNNIKIQFQVPKTPLILDTNNVLTKENYGFEYVDGENDNQKADQDNDEKSAQNLISKNNSTNSSQNNSSQNSQNSKPVSSNKNPSAKIQSVKVVDDSVEITLDKTPTGKNKKIQYGLKADYLPDNRGSGTGALVRGSSGGNLRDSDENISLYGNTLWNWAVHFEQNLE